MLPLRDSNPTDRFAIVTLLLIVLNVAVFLTEPIRANPGEQARYFICHAAIPHEITSGHQLAGAATSLGCPGKSVVLSILASMFLHGGWLHLGGNMLFLWIFGNNVEDRLGRIKYLVFYLLCGLVATAAQIAISPGSNVPMIGASGAIAGVLGGYLVLFPKARVKTLLFWFIVDLPAVAVLLGWFALQIFQGVGSISAEGGVAYFAHIGGFIAGMALVLPFGGHRPRRARRTLGGI